MQTCRNDNKKINRKQLTPQKTTTTTTQPNNNKQKIQQTTPPPPPPKKKKRRRRAQLIISASRQNAQSSDLTGPQLPACPSHDLLPFPAPDPSLSK